MSDCVSVLFRLARWAFISILIFILISISIPIFISISISFLFFGCDGSSEAPQ